MLWLTYPVEEKGWVGSAKNPDPSTITVWAIGLKRSFLVELKVAVQIYRDTSSPPVPHPHVVIVVPGDNFHIIGGGAHVNRDIDPSAVGAC
jgi:hypothetical protein